MSNLGNLCFLSLTFNWQLHGRILFPTMEKLQRWHFRNLSQSVNLKLFWRLKDGQMVTRFQLPINCLNGRKVPLRASRFDLFLKKKSKLQFQSFKNVLITVLPSRTQDRSTASHWWEKGNFLPAKYHRPTLFTHQSL